MSSGNNTQEAFKTEDIAESNAPPSPTSSFIQDLIAKTDMIAEVSGLITMYLQTGDRACLKGARKVQQIAGPDLGLQSPLKSPYLVKLARGDLLERTHCEQAVLELNDLAPDLDKFNITVGEIQEISQGLFKANTSLEYRYLKVFIMTFITVHLRPGPCQIIPPDVVEVISHYTEPEDFDLAKAAAELHAHLRRIGPMYLIAMPWVEKLMAILRRAPAQGNIEQDLGTMWIEHGDRLTPNSDISTVEFIHSLNVVQMVNLISKADGSERDPASSLEYLADVVKQLGKTLKDKDGDEDMEEDDDNNEIGDLEAELKALKVETKALEEESKTLIDG